MRHYYQECGNTRQINWVTEGLLCFRTAITAADVLRRWREGKQPTGRCLVKFPPAGPRYRLIDISLKKKKPIHFLFSDIRRRFLGNLRVMCTHSTPTLQHTGEIYILTCQLYYCMHKPVQLQSVHHYMPTR